MSEVVFQLILELIEYVLFQFISQVLIEIGFKPIAEAFRRKRSRNPVVAYVGCVLFGGIVGLISALILPRRVIPVANQFAGLSVLIAPVATGLLMRTFGDFQRRHGKTPSFLATFWGGSLFAFSFALIRWLLVGRG
jgi:hypothetical protein